MLPFELKITQKFVFKGHYPEMAKMTKSRTSNFILKTSIWWSYKIFLYPILHMKTGLLPVCQKYPTYHIDTLAYNPTRLDFFDYFWYKYLVVLVTFGKKILQQCYYQLNLTQKHRPSIPIPPLTLQNNKNHQKTVLTKKCRGEV